MTAQTLIDAARAAASGAYAPYSGFGVGAAILLRDGTIVTGANFENASYGLSLCAETVALAKVANEGRLSDVIAIGITGGTLDSTGTIAGSDAVRPCGRCRQMLNEAAQAGGRDITVYCAPAQGALIETHALSNLLPHAFGPADLGIGGN